MSADEPNFTNREINGEESRLRFELIIFIQIIFFHFFLLIDSCVSIEENTFRHIYQTVGSLLCSKEKILGRCSHIAPLQVHVVEFCVLVYKPIFEDILSLSFGKVVSICVACLLHVIAPQV